MLTQGKHIDILHYDQLVMVFVENCAVDQVPHILLITLGEVKHGLGVPFRGLSKTLTLGIFTNTFQNRPHCPSKLVDALLVFLWG